MKNPPRHGLAAELNSFYSDFNSYRANSVMRKSFLSPGVGVVFPEKGVEILLSVFQQRD